MPIYEYQGQQYEMAETDPYKAKERILAYVSKPKESSFVSQLKETLTPNENTGEALGAGFLNRALGLSRGLGGDVAESQIKSQAASDAMAKTNPMAVGLGGMAVDVAAAAPGLVAAGTVGATGLGAMALEGALAGAPAGLGRAGEQYQKVLTETGDKDTALKSAAIEGAGGVVDFALPASMGGKLGARMLGGAALNVPTSIAQTHAQNAVLPENMQQDPYDPVNLTINAAMGAGFGAMGTKTNPFKSGSKETPSVEQGAYIPEEFKNQQGFSQDTVLKSLNNYERTLSDIERDLSTAIHFKNEEKVAALTEEKQKTEYHIQNLKEYLGGEQKQQEQVPQEAYDELTLPQHVTEQIPDEAYQELALERTETPLESTQMPEGIPSPRQDITEAPRAITEVPEKSMDTRHTEFNSIDWDNVHPDTIQHELDRRQKYLHDNVVTPNLRNILDTEITHLQKIQLESSIKSDSNNRINISRESDKVDIITPDIINNIDNNNIKGALQVVSTRSNNPTLRILANALSNNPHVTGTGKLGFDFGINSIAQHAEKTQDISFKDTQSVGPIALIHETIHRATATVIDTVKAGLSKNGIHKTAVKNLENLYNTIWESKSKVLQNKYEALGGKASDLPVLMKNLKEFVAYGTTDPLLASALQQVKYKNSNVFTKMIDGISNMLGLSKEANTAYHELIKNTMVLAEHSDVPPAIRNDINPMAVGTKVDVKEGFSMMKSGISKIKSEMFTNQMPALNRSNKALQELDIAVTNTQHDTVKITNNIIYGKADPTAPISIKRKASDTSLESTTLRLKPQELHSVLGTMADLYSNFRALPRESKADAKARFAEMVKQAQSSMTKDQIAYMDANYKAANDVREFANDMYAANGLQLQVPEKIGYFLINRSGKHGVLVSLNGTPVHMERFISEVEANKFMKKVQEQYPELSTESLKNEKDGLMESIQESLEYLKERHLATGVDTVPLVDAMINELTGTTKAIGGHLQHRSGITGYAGTEWFMSKNKQAERYIDGAQNAITEYIESVRRRALILKSADILDKHPNLTQLEREEFNTYLDANVNSRSDLSIVPKLDQLLRDTPQKIFSNLAGKADAPYLDTALRKMNSFMYFKTLGLVPQQWLAQFLSFTAGSRELFNRQMTWNGKDIAANNNPFKAMASAGAGIRDYGKLLAGAEKSLDPKLEQAIRWAATDTEVFRPHISDSILEQAKFSNKRQTLNKVLGFLNAGNAFADSHSRVLAYITYWHQFKDSGLSPKEQASLCAKLVDDNMLLMGERYQPLIYGHAGLVGKIISPLKTYAHGYAGNMLADIKGAKDLNGILRLSATALSAIMVGGIISAPILADYDWLCEHLNMPEAKMSKWAMENLPDFATYGMISDLSKEFVDGGVDVGSSLRYRSLFELLDFSNSASASIVGKAIGGAGKLAYKGLGGMVTPADTREAAMNLVPRGLPAGAVDDMFFDTDTRDTVKKTGTEQALSDYGPADRAATYLGGKSIEESNVRLADRQRKLEETKRTQQNQKAIEFILGGKPDEVEHGIQILVDSGMNAMQIRTMIKNATKNQAVPEYVNSVMKNTYSGRRQNEQYGGMYRDR